MQKAFTLIELLVVVLIIGILSAIALPQYQKSVIKSRVAGTMPMLKAIKDAQEVYYLDNSSYGWISDLSIDVPLEQKYVSGTTAESLHLGNEWIFVNNKNGNESIRALYCKGHMSRTPEEGCVDAGTIFLLFYYDKHATYPGKIKCVWRNSTMYGKICATFASNTSSTNFNTASGEVLL